MPISESYLLPVTPENIYILSYFMVQNHYNIGVYAYTHTHTHKHTHTCMPTRFTCTCIKTDMYADIYHLQNVKFQKHFSTFQLFREYIAKVFVFATKAHQNSSNKNFNKKQRSSYSFHLQVSFQCQHYLLLF
jgi:hypothetical protein